MAKQALTIRDIPWLTEVIEKSEAYLDSVYQTHPELLSSWYRQQREDQEKEAKMAETEPEVLTSEAIRDAETTEEKNILAAALFHDHNTALRDEGKDAESLSISFANGAYTFAEAGVQVGTQTQVWDKGLFGL